MTTPAPTTPLSRHRVERRNTASSLRWSVVDPDGQTLARYSGRPTAQREADRLDAATAPAQPASVPCAYFMLCTNQAVGTLPNPALGPVAACQSCADHVGAGDRLQPFGDAS